jgi:Flp pilus assembly protein TadG
MVVVGCGGRDIERVGPEGPPGVTMRLRRLARLGRDERGTAVVEFALVLLPLALIVFGILDFGRALEYYNNMTQLAGQGARAASVNQNPDGTAAGATFQHQLACLASTGELRNGITVQVTHVPTNVGDPVTVQTSFSFHFIPLIRTTNLTLNAASTQRYETPQTPGFSPTNDVSGGAATCP